MPSLIQVITEDNRESAAHDAKFFKNFFYFFELQVPAEAFSGFEAAVTTVSLLFPLVLNPTGITLSEPFTVNVTPTAQGGLFVEENGIIQRSLRIEGHTGFKPRSNFSKPGIDAVKLENPSFTARGRWTPFALSGQRHFHFLQDRVFRTYADLKRNPSTAKDTKLIFHNPKDDEHWRVIPQNFTMTRDARDRVLYRYSIELLIVEVAAEKHPPSEDKSLIDKIKDVIRTVRGAIDLATGAVNDVIRAINELESIVSGVISVVSSVNGFLAAARGIIDGTADLIARPAKEVADIVNGLDTMIESLFEAPFDAIDTVAASFRQIGDAFDQFAIHPQIFQSVTTTKLTRQRSRQELTTGTSTAALEAAEANPPMTLRSLSNLGTAPLPGDKQKSAAESGVARGEPFFSSAEERIVSEGDTLQSLAALYLGSASRWRQIAVLNDLAPPFISTQGLPGTLRTGDKILVPSVARPPDAQPLAAILGVSPSAPLAERLLGTDFLLSPVAGSLGAPLFDFVVDVAGGSIDAKFVSGIPNLAQAIRTRVTTEQGTDVLYTQLGYKRLVGVGVPVVDSELGQFRLSEAVVADPRIESIRGVELLPSNADSVEVEIDAAVLGFHARVTIQTRVF